MRAAASRTATAMLLGSLAALVAAAPAAAEFGSVELLSKTPVQQAEQALAPAISADGRYVAFQARIGNSAGLFREDLQTHGIAPVAVAPVSEGGSIGYAKAPSISADGRYVAFTTNAPLDPEDDVQPGSADVYVADMDASPPTYELASALDGCDPDASSPHGPCGLTYVGSGGSEATARVALSADGRKVAFVTSAESNLTSGLGGSTEGVPTPAREVVLRNLETDKTTLVSVERDAATATMTERPVPGGALVAKVQLPLLRGASISADGSTVAWIGTHLPAQVPLSTGEAASFEALDAGSFPYDEPLWRRVADGPQAPIRRVVAGEGAADPIPLPTEKNVDVNSAEGWLGAEHIDGVPQLSADGRTVALIGNPTEATNAFVVDMSPGLTRAEAVRQLTRETVVNPANPAGTINKKPYFALNGHIFDIAISGDGGRIAFATARQQFPLTPPSLVGSPPVSVGLVELYVVDLEAETLERATHGLAGPEEASLDPIAVKQPEGANLSEGDGAAAPSFGADGRIAFSSTASNLVAGDGNESSDVFLVEESEGDLQPGATTITPGPDSPSVRPGWRLTLHATSLADGAVRLVAGVPAAGRLRAAVAPEPGGRVRARRLSTAGARSLGSGRLALELRLPRRLRRFAHGPEGVYATARVSFRARGRGALKGRVQLRFHAHKRPPGGAR